MKKLSRITAIIMAVAIVLTCFAVPSFAAGKKKSYLLIGDSIAVGAGLANSQDACYGRIVADTNGYTYKNNAISGTPSSVLLELLKVDYMIADIKAADIITISIGGNDYLTSNTVTLLLGGAIGINAQFDYIRKQFEENFAQIISEIKKLNPKAKLLVQTVYNPCDNFFDYVYQKGVDRINDTIKAYRQANPGSIEIVDVEPVFAGHADEYIAADTLHPNAKGNLEIAKVTLQKLKELKLGTSTTPVIKTPAINWTDTDSESMSNIFDYFIKTISKYIDILFK